VQVHLAVDGATISFLKTHTNIPKKKLNYPCMIMRVNPQAFCRKIFEKQKKSLQNEPM